LTDRQELRPPDFDLLFVYPDFQILVTESITESITESACGMHSAECQSGGLFSVDAGSDLSFQPALSEGGEQVAVAQGVGEKLQERFSGLMTEARPEGCSVSGNFL